jgi:hypothetical protein
MSSTHSSTLVLLSPYEANELLPDIRTSRTAFLHIYAPRTSRNIRTLEDLDFITIPQRRTDNFPDKTTIHNLNLFAGQLFFRSPESYDEVLQMLGLWLKPIPAEQKGKVDADGFVLNDAARKALNLGSCMLTKSPVVALQKLVAMRRKGQGFTMTHIGKTLDGRDLKEKDFDGLTAIGSL